MLKKTVLQRFDTPFGGPDIVLSLKDSGDMAFRETGNTPERRKLFASLGISPERTVSCRQIHSKKIYTVDSAVYGTLEGDGLITENRDLVLCATAADCMPLFLFDRRGGPFGIVHSGWKGTGIIENAVRIIQDMNGTPLEDIVVVMGPSAGVCCYEVDRVRFDNFKALWGEKSAEKRDGAYFIDLPGANRSILERIGITNIYSFHQCTICNKEYGSFRREGPDMYTRMLAMIGYFE